MCVIIAVTIIQSRINSGAKTYVTLYRASDSIARLIYKPVQFAGYGFEIATSFAPWNLRHSRNNARHGQLSMRARSFACNYRTGCIYRNDTYVILGSLIANQLQA